MANIRRFFLFTIGVLFLFGCDPERDRLLLFNGPSSENDQAPLAVTGEITNAEVSFEQNLLPILTARCAFAGCHDANGPDGIDLSTYQAFIRGGEDGPVFEPGNAQSSDVVEEIVSGRMPLGGPRLSNDQIQLFIDWINQQEATIIAGVRRDHNDDDDDDNDDDDDDDHDHDHDDDDNDDDDDDDHDHDDDDNDDDDDDHDDDNDDDDDDHDDDNDDDDDDDDDD